MIKKRMSIQTIGYDKLNQLRHLHYFKNPEAFPYQEINPRGVPKSMIDRLMTLSARFTSDGYAEKAEEILKTVPDYIADWFYIPLK